MSVRSHDYQYGSVLSFGLLHAGGLVGVFLAPFSAAWLLISITGGHHRYFSHLLTKGGKSAYSDWGEGWRTAREAECPETLA